MMMAQIIPATMITVITSIHLTQYTKINRAVRSS